MTPRDPGYLAYVRTFPCVSCGKDGAEAHHAGRKYMGLKPSDYTAIPLCHDCHMELHSEGHATFYDAYGINLYEVIASLLHTFVSGEPLEMPNR